MRTLQSKRYFFRILAVTVSIFLVLCVLFFVAAYSRAKQTSKEAFFKAEIDRNEKLARQADIYFDQLIKVGGAFFNISIPYGDLHGMENYQIRSIFNSMITSHVNANAFISGIDISINGTAMFPSDVAHEKILGHFSFYDIYSTESITWPYSFDLVTNEKISNQLTVTLNGYLLSENLFSFEDSDRQDYLLSEYNVVLLTNKKDAFFKEISTVLENVDLNAENGSFLELKTSGSYYYTVSEANKYGFRLLSMVHKNAYTTQYSAILPYSALVTCSLLVVSILSAVFLTVKFYRPIKKTVALLQTYIPEDIHNYENEIMYIQKSILKYSTANKATQLLSQKTFSGIQGAHAAALQHQINSHFLFNTLENIKGISISELGIDNEVENSISTLNTIIREGIYQKNIIVSLSYEIGLTQSYVELMILRFPDVSVVWDIDESLLNHTVIKFSLQPFLENSFLHGFHEFSSLPKTVQICVKKQSDHIVIGIQDNGSGMTKEVRQSLLSQLESNEILDSVSHVGILNVHRRIVDIYGPDYGVSLIPVQSGCTVEIHFPLSPDDPT